MPPVQRTQKFSTKLPNKAEAELLLALLTNDNDQRHFLIYSVHKDEFRSALRDGRYSRKRLLRKLENQGLVSLEDTIEDGHSELFCMLTRQGRAVAKVLAELRDLLPAVI